MDNEGNPSVQHAKEILESSRLYRNNDRPSIFSVDFNDINQIHKCLENLYHLNHWAKCKDLFYDDRQGLYEIKDEILKHLYENKVLSLHSYVDGTKCFNPYVDDKTYNIEQSIEYHCEMIIDCQFDSGMCPSSEDKDFPWHTEANQLYIDVFHKRATTDGLNTDEIEALKTYIKNELLTLYQNSLDKNEPIDYQELKRLCIYPCDITSQILRFGEYDWERADEKVLSNLDPQGASLVGFIYADEQYRFSFHLPYRKATDFVAESQILSLKNINERDAGLYFGREITTEEQSVNGVVELVNYFGYPVSYDLFPHYLELKSSHFFGRQKYYENYSDDDDDD